MDMAGSPDEAQGQKALQEALQEAKLKIWGYLPPLAPL